MDSATRWDFVLLQSIGMFALSALFNISNLPRDSTLTWYRDFASSVSGPLVAMDNVWKALLKVSLFEVEYCFFAEGYVLGEKVVEVVVDSRIIYSTTKTGE